MCSLAKLFWESVPGPLKCTGSVGTFGELGLQELIINRITPFQVDGSHVANISVCRFHKVGSLCYLYQFISFSFIQDWLTGQHPSYKQGRCSLAKVSNGVESKCQNTADKKGRVSLEMSRFIFQSADKHIPSGSGI